MGRDLSVQKYVLWVWGKAEEQTAERLEQCSSTNKCFKVSHNLSKVSRLLFGPMSVTGTRSKTRLRRDNITVMLDMQVLCRIHKL